MFWKLMTDLNRLGMDNNSMNYLEIDDSYVDLSETDPSIVQSARYSTKENFVGRRIFGYDKNQKMILKKSAALSLKRVQNFFKAFEYTLVVYDAYRPPEAVDHFWQWALSNELNKKSYYYPTIVEKKELFNLGYIAHDSAHCKGYTVDLTIMDIGKRLHAVVPHKRTLKNNEIVCFLDDGTVDMGTGFDFFHECSHHDSDLLNKNFIDKRNFLRSAMERFNFKCTLLEWWHYTYDRV